MGAAEKERAGMKRRMMALAMAAVMAAGMTAASVPAASTVSSAAESASGAEEVQSGATGVEDGTLSIAMECAYAPYNWAQPTDDNGAVPIVDSNEYASGYDIMMAKKICDAYGWKLEVHQLDWDSLVPAVQSGQVDAVIAGQSMTKERAEQVDFAGPYLYASIVCLVKSDSKFADAKGKSDLSGGNCTSQQGTIWYDKCLPQIKGAKVQEAAESAPAMLMALETGTVDFVCTDMPTAEGALVAYPDLKILDFSSGSDDFKVSDEDVNIGISVRKGNVELKNKINDVVGKMTKDDFNKMMSDATKIQPLSES